MAREGGREAGGCREEGAARDGTGRGAAVGGVGKLVVFGSCGGVSSSSS